MEPAAIEALIRAHIDGADVRVASDDNTHFEAIIVASQFDGLRAIRRHQLVYESLGERMGGEIHALSIQAFTPAEWSARESG